MALIDLKDCTVTFKDGTGTPLTVTAVVGEGNFQWTEKRNIEYHKDRGKLATGLVREGDEEPVDVSFEFVFDYLTTKAADATIELDEMIKGATNGTSTLVSTGDACEPYACDIVINREPPAGCGDDELYTFAEFRYENISYDLRAGTISCTGTCNITAPTVARTA
jgi:hypothetical protein